MFDNEEGRQHSEHGPKHGPKHGPGHDIPPHILKEIMDLKEKVGKLEGMVDILTKTLLK